ncbi:MAG: hypothetical protein MJ200_04460 [Mycoplasmoidaceae bacterium]|nr:hypothetical protein [Mycoplasmoidaceae bacterium]
MSYKSSAESKTVDVSKVPKQAPLVDGKTVTLTGFSTNFEFTEDGYDQIVFQTVSNYAIVFSDNIININYDSATQTTTFDLQLELYVRDLANDEIATSIYLNNVFISAFNTKIDYGNAVLAHSYEVQFVNGDNPTIETWHNIFQTNFDFRINGEPVDDKPLITVE